MVLETLSDALRQAPLPPTSGIQPSEHELKQVEHALRTETFDRLSRRLQRWVCHDLMPSLQKFGTYPPPDRRNQHYEAPASSP